QSLAGLYLSDDESNKTKWAFPQDASIAAHDYAIVWADEDGMQAGWHANFKLSKSGEMILFGYGDSNVLEQYTFGQQQSDISKGRCANGIGDFVSQSPSFGAVNNCNVASHEIIETHTIMLYPNPANNELIISAETGITKVEVMNMMGNKLQEINCNTPLLNINVSALVPGLYLARVNGESVNRFAVVH
ncbi:MAG: T9SS type A sorting domain-containing protein, partial [Saprospiraceae bacterium]